jgi:hypothetical protein
MMLHADQGIRTVVLLRARILIHAYHEAYMVSKLH